jgi:hypothetical protein
LARLEAASSERRERIDRFLFYLSLFAASVTSAIIGSPSRGDLGAIEIGGETAAIQRRRILDFDPERDIRRGYPRPSVRPFDTAIVAMTSSGRRSRHVGVRRQERRSDRACRSRPAAAKPGVLVATRIDFLVRYGNCEVEQLQLQWLPHRHICFPRQIGRDCGKRIFCEL